MYSEQASWSALLPTIDTRICGTAERLQFRVYLNLGALGER
jgi:hypothetical protein